MSKRIKLSLESLAEKMNAELVSIDDRKVFYNRLVRDRLEHCISTDMEDVDDAISNMLISIENKDLKSLSKFLRKFNKAISKSYDSFIKSSIKMKTFIDENLANKDSDNN